MENILSVLAKFFAATDVRFIIGHIVVNLVMAIAAGLKQKDFDFRRVAEFLWRKLLPYVLGYAVVKVIGDWCALTPLLPITWIAIETTLLGDLIDNLAKLGLKLPDFITTRISVDGER